MPRTDPRFAFAAAALAALASIAPAQFSSGSDGSDGALAIEGGLGTIVLPKGALDPDGDGVFHFTAISIGAGTTVQLVRAEFGKNPLTFLASGDVTIAGKLWLNGESGIAVSANSGRVPARGGPGGFDAGLSSTTANPPPTAGDGPGGGTPATTMGSGGGGAGHFAAGATANQGTGRGDGGPAYGNELIFPLIGGSGGGGGRENGAHGPGAGGGALLLAASGTIDIPAGGEIAANGGISPAYGGGGSGGALRIVAQRIQGAGNLRALGGTASFGGAGSKGRIRLEAFDLAFTGSSDPVAFSSNPYPVGVPDGAPSLRIVSIDGQAVAEDPQGEFAMPDVVIDNGGEVVLALAASSIPLGTQIALRLTSEGNVVVATSTPLEGTFASSTATATMTIPSGFSRCYLTASW